MAITTRWETIEATDGSGSFEAYCAVPESGSGPGVLLFQEIFGVNDNMRGLADKVANEGFVALVPDMFWRIEPRFERKDESGIGDAFAVVQKFDAAKGVEDIKAAHAHLRGMRECTGKVGAMGFCLGGGLAYLAATQSKVDASVPYYGSAINDLLDQVGDLDCPTMFHYGNNDAFIPEEKIAEVEGAVAGKPNVTFHRYPAGHAFSNWDAPSMYDEACAEQAWSRTLAFLDEHLR
jgi:carboxymethylenebutenolidase